jgi:hypothetical protein
MGASALQSNTQGDNNTSIGAAALLNDTATGNTAIGSNALSNNTTGGILENIQGVDVGPNVAVGWQALESSTVASANTAVDYQALHSFTAGPMDFEQLGVCTAVGFQALANATGNGFANSAFGYQSLYNNGDGGADTAIDLQALLSNTTGSSNVAIGNNALSNNTAGNNNAALGFNTGAAVTTASNVICIGAFGQNVDDSCFIGNKFGTIIDPVTLTLVGVDSTGKLGTLSSSRRFKHDIKSMDKSSETILALKPVAFHYKSDAKNTRCFGLIAEQVAAVDPDLVVSDNNGEILTVRYDQVNAMLLNEFLKEHCAVQEQKATIAQLKSTIERQETTNVEQQRQIAAPTSGLAKVNSQLEASKRAPQVVANDQ